MSPPLTKSIIDMRLYLSFCILIISSCGTQYNQLKYHKHNDSLSKTTSEQIEGPEFISKTSEDQGIILVKENHPNEAEYTITAYNNEVSDITNVIDEGKASVVNCEQSRESFVSSVSNRDKSKDKDLEKGYKTKATIMMILYFFILALSIIALVFLSTYFIIPAVAGTLAQLPFIIVHSYLRKKVIRHTEDESTASKAHKMKWVLLIIFLVFVVGMIVSNVLLYAIF